MTTETETGAQVDAATLWRAIGRMEGDTVALKEGQREIQAQMRELQAALRDVNRRIDRLFYAMIAIGGALLTAIIASRIFGG